MLTCYKYVTCIKKYNNLTVSKEYHVDGETQTCYLIKDDYNNHIYYPKFCFENSKKDYYDFWSEIDYIAK